MTEMIVEVKYSKTIVVDKKVRVALIERLVAERLLGTWKDYCLLEIRKALEKPELYEW